MKRFCYKHKRKFKEEDLPCIKERCESKYCPVLISGIVEIPEKELTMEELEQKILK